MVHTVIDDHGIWERIRAQIELKAENDKLLQERDKLLQELSAELSANKEDAEPGIPPILQPQPKRSDSGVRQQRWDLQQRACGAAEPAAPLPGDSPEKRVARNGSAYTWGQFRTFYGLRGRAEWEWAHAPALVRRGPGNSISGPVMTNAERIVQDMYDWYNARDLEQPLDEVFRQLQNTLFKNVIAPVEEDVWRRRDSGGASQPRAQGETHLVVTREHVARQVETVIKYRENGWKTKASKGTHV